MKNMLNPNANPLYTGAYSMIGRASGSPSGGSSTTTTRLRPYHVRFVLVFTLASPPSAPFSRSGERSSMLMPCTPRGVPGTGFKLLRREPVANGACIDVRPLRFVTEPCADAEPTLGACEYSIYLFKRTVGHTIDACRMRALARRLGGRVRARAPEQLDEALLEVLARRDDGVEVVGPHDEHALVTLR